MRLQPIIFFTLGLALSLLSEIPVEAEPTHDTDSTRCVSPVSPEITSSFQTFHKISNTDSGVHFFLAPPQPLPPSAPRLKNVAVAGPNQFFVLLDEKLVSGRGKAGAKIHFRVASNFLATDGTTIPGGTPAEGTLIESSGPKNWGRPGKIRLICETVVLTDGTRIAVHLVNSGILKGRDERPALNMIRVPLETLGVISLLAANSDSNSNSGGFDFSGAIDVIAGVTLISAGELLHGIFGVVAHGGNRTIEPGTPFLVELADKQATSSRLP